MDKEITKSKKYVSATVKVTGHAWSKHFTTISDQAGEPKMLIKAFEKLKASMIPKLYTSILKEETVYYQQQAHIKTINREQIVFSMRFQRFPPVPRQLFTGLNITFLPQTLTFEQIKAELDEMLWNATPARSDPAYQIQDGDHVIIKLEGFLGTRKVLKWNQQRVRIKAGQNRLLPALDKAILGMKANELKEIETVFSSAHPNPQLHRKGASFKIRVLDVLDKNKKPQLTDAFARTFAIRGVTNKTELMTHIEYVLQEQNKQANITNFARRFFALLLPHLDFDIPNQIIDQTATAIRLERKLARHGLAVGLVNEDSDNDFLAIAKIKRDIVLDDIARQLGIVVSESAIMKQYQKIARLQNITIARAHHQLPILMARKMALNRKVIEKLIEMNSSLN